MSSTTTIKLHAHVTQFMMSSARVTRNSEAESESSAAQHRPAKHSSCLRSHVRIDLASCRKSPISNNPYSNSVPRSWQMHRSLLQQPSKKLISLQCQAPRASVGRELPHLLSPLLNSCNDFKQRISDGQTTRSARYCMHSSTQDKDPSHFHPQRGPFFLPQRKPKAIQIQMFWRSNPHGGHGSDHPQVLLCKCYVNDVGEVCRKRL
jgi:hypothetical protein